MEKNQADTTRVANPPLNVAHHTVQAQGIEAYCLFSLLPTKDNISLLLEEELILNWTLLYMTLQIQGVRNKHLIGSVEVTCTRTNCKESWKRDVYIPAFNV